MDRERAKELLPIIQAYAEGEEIEYRWISDDDGPDGAWITPDREFESGGEYRIKPEPFECWVFVDEYDKVKASYNVKQNWVDDDLRQIHMRQAVGEDDAN